LWIWCIKNYVLDLQALTVRVRAAKGELIESPQSAASAAYARDALAKVSVEKLRSGQK
jgi:hypothetical protein